MKTGYFELAASETLSILGNCKYAFFSKKKNALLLVSLDITMNASSISSHLLLRVILTGIN